MHEPASHDARYPLDAMPWVPVATQSGATVRVGLRELFLRAHEFTGLAVASPPAAAGLMRVLCAITARVTGLDTMTGDSGPDPWLDARFELLEDGGGFDQERVLDYFVDHADGLRLYDEERPFLQDARLAHECASTSGINKLVLGRPAGNNQVFFGHFSDDDPVPLPSEEAVLHLIAQLYYGPSGQCTPRTVDGQKYGNVNAGPLRRVLSCHPLGRNLRDTLLLGLPLPERPSAQPGRTDRCPWEDPRPIAALEPAAPSAGPRQLLTDRHQHAVLLHPSGDGGHAIDATITWALRHNRPPVDDPYLIWDEAKDGTLYPRRADAERAMWRDLDGLVLQDRGGRSRRPGIFESLTGTQLPEDTSAHLRVVAYGFDQDGQTRDRSYFTAVTPPLFALLAASRDAPDRALALGIKAGREAAEHAAWRLEKALHATWRTYTLPFGDDAGSGRKKKERGSGPWPEQALAAFWPAAEEQFWQLFDNEDFSAALAAFGAIALRVFDDLTAPIAVQPRGAKAREAHRGLVRSMLDRQRA
ncbi:type I-E CRISPR-associated protein Cse1/CasA [Streptomyces sp. NPDC090025]|uniref:type I-E CRISPR-associated protein Cse1/CasA n=1 Tax=Streptomyces sp. NPDC090025 TaxID=3365922 RepID=UPI0038339845